MTQKYRFWYDVNTGIFHYRTDKTSPDRSNHYDYIEREMFDWNNHRVDLSTGEVVEWAEAPTSTTKATR
jgi:hypothetical protein